jgi:hypothetical protein
MNITGRELLVFVLVVLVVLLSGLLFLGFFGSFGSIIGHGMMGPGMMGPGRMGGFGGFGWLLTCFVPLGLLALLIGGIVWLVTAITNTQGSSRQPQVRCSNCKRPVQADWQVCPYCGTPLREEEAK